MLPTDNEAPVQPMPEEGDTVTTDQPKVDPADKKRWAEFRQRVEICKTYRKKLIRNWTTNIDYRRGKSFNSQDDSDTVSVNLDWSNTKTKQAALFSQVPKVRVAHSPESVSVPWVAPFERRLNDILKESGVEAVMDETLPDCINAAGIGVAMVSREALTTMKKVPSVDLSIFPPQIQATALQTGKLFGQDIPMEDAPQVVDSRYTVRRISPSDFLWPTDFTGSDFDNAPWLGYSGELPWAEAAHRWNLTEEDKDKVVSTEKTVEDKLSHDYDREHSADDGKVGFDEIFYHEFQYHTEAKSFKTLRHIVFLAGKNEPVIDEPWTGQQVNEDGTIIGSTKKPIRVLTLAYVTDEDIPPSDSAVGRAQVNELNRGRNQISKQRARNSPHTWIDVNRLDPAIQGALIRGTWQHAIPVQGDGSRVIGSIQQPPIPQENFMFDKIAKADLQELWTIGSNQVGVGNDVETKGESNNIQANFQTKIGRERARVATFFTGIAEVVGSLMCLFEDPAVFGEGFDPSLSQKLNYSILVDSTVLLDSNQRLERLDNFINKYAKSGFIQLEPVLREIATLSGLDPNTVVKAPDPQQPAPPNISLRLTGGDDMMNPLLLAFMLKTGQGPDPKLIDQAKELIQMSVTMPDPMAPPQGPQPQAPPPPIGEAHPDASLMPTIGDRAEGQEGT